MEERPTSELLLASNCENRARGKKLGQLVYTGAT